MAQIVKSTKIDPDKLFKECQSQPTTADQKRIHSKTFGQLDGVKQHGPLQNMVKHHIDSFDFMVNEGLAKGIKNIRPLQIELPNGDRLELKIMEATISPPEIRDSFGVRAAKLYPSECRQRGTSYEGKVYVTFSWSINGRERGVIRESVGEIPIMIKSSLCNLQGLTPAQMVRKKEDAEEFGGYFIVNGNERVVRLLTAQRRNYPIGISRNNWKESGQLFTEFGISIRCVRDDQLGSNMVLHYLTNGTAKLRIFYQREPIFMPLIMIMKALVNYPDLKIFKELVKGKENDTYYKSCVTNMMRLVQAEGLHTQEQIKKYIGSRFRVKCQDLPPWLTDEEITDHLLKESVAVHLDKNVDKFNLLVFMTKKLFALARNECAIENPDNPAFHEVSLSGHIFFTLLLERLAMFLSSVRQMLKLHFDPESRVRLAASASGRSPGILANAALNAGDIDKVLRKAMQIKYSTITKPLHHLIATGNLQSRTGLGLMQNSGLSVMAEKINFWRFLSHFRAVHRGSFFMEMRTTACRKLYPEAWGFLCPVHTPDGGPCGLLNHLSELCLVTNFQSSIRKVPDTLVELGMEPFDALTVSEENLANYYPVLLDGRLLGYVRDMIASQLVATLRIYKAQGQCFIPSDLEIGFVPKTNKPTQYPGIFLFSNPARLVRPVYHLEAQKVEIIGTFEQPYLDIAVCPEEVDPKRTTHQELKETCFMSVLAAQVPYPDFNQSPRNMYACQMCKQTMGTPSHTLKYRNDNKMYDIQMPQSPLVRPALHDYYNIDDYPFGTNAVVAVISYTGYDMEDALVLNKSSVERGCQNGSIYKTLYFDLGDLAGGRYGSEPVALFGRNPQDKFLDDKIDMDGLPFIGNRVTYDDPLCSYIDLATNATKVEKYKSTDVAYVWSVKLLANENPKSPLQKISITLYVPRRPTIGDKFANRHGQKGVCSFLWPQENMPFTEGGLTPDIIFNPHGYPSRMTIGMMIETLAGKSGSMHGKIYDATPFTFSENVVASDYMGKCLEQCGFNYFGTERMYSGIDGRELKADIFIGVIFYIRLRHMVNDKFQVRSTGPIDYLTKQPVKGRKRCGGIRFGEMERDSLLAHGTSFLLQDRLFHNSDKSYGYVCTKCGSILSPYALPSDLHNPELMGCSDHRNNEWTCKTCNSSNDVRLVALPYVFRYLVAELASVNIKVCLNVK